jgi:hypothetical protein
MLKVKGRVVGPKGLMAIMSSINDIKRGAIPNSQIAKVILGRILLKFQTTCLVKRLVGKELM